MALMFSCSSGCNEFEGPGLTTGRFLIRRRPRHPPREWRECRMSMISEVDAGRVLDFAAVVAARDPGAPAHRAAAYGHIRIAGHERVGKVVELHAQLELRPLAELEVFHQSRVQLPEARTA